MHDGLPEMLSIDNMANGAVREMVNEAIARLAANVLDPNTKAEQKRSMTLKIEAKPFKDRSGAEYTVTADTKLAGLQGVDGTMYFSKKAGNVVVFGRNHKQLGLDLEPIETNPQQNLAKNKTN